MDEQHLSNGRYQVVVTETGGGYSTWRGLALTRWTADPTRDGDGTFCYVRDLDSGVVWSAGDRPVQRTPRKYAARFAPGAAAIAREDEDITTLLEVAVSPSVDLELRRLTLTNLSDRPRRLEVTTYVEPVLTVLEDDLAHPAFSKLFVTTALLPDVAGGTLLARRRARVPEEPVVLLGHALLIDGAAPGERPEYETDRARFVGRGRTLGAPAALIVGATLSGTTGHVLDPILSLRRAVTLAPRGTSRLLALYAAAPSEPEVTELIAAGAARP